MQRQRRLADAAFLIEERDDHGALPAAGGRLSSAAKNALSVRKNPKDSGLDKLRGPQAIERQGVSADSGPR
jgi:hypothetical protein